MGKPTGGAVLRAVRGSALAGLTDRELLERFAAGDEGAFEALVGRHGGMVLGVCRRVVPTLQDAEDACQATFLVLSRKAAGGRWQPSVANWLYTTARRVAAKANRAAQRRAKREARVHPPEPVSLLDAMTGREAFAALDDELARLPVIYREPLVLCYLEGLTRDEAAARLGVPSATVKSQLDRGRKRLADALTRRGIALGAGLLAVAATSSAGASPPRLMETILAAAGGSPSVSVAALARGVVMGDVLTKAKLAVLAAVATVGMGFGFASVPVAADPPKSAEKMDKPAAKADAGEVTADKLTVRVVGPDGKPAAGATVRRIGRNWSGTPAETVLGMTDAAGKLVVPAAPAGSYTAVADGVGVAWSGYDPRGPEVALAVAKPHPIRGRLTDLQGKPVANAKVVVESVSAAENDDLTAAYNAFRVNPEWTARAFDRTLDGDATGAPAGTTTDADGRFTLTGVGRNQVVRLRFYADGIESAGVTVFADPEFAARTRPPTDAEKRRSGFSTLQHKPAVYGPEFTHPARPEHLLTGTVVDAATGKPVKGVTVWGTTVPITAGRSLPAWADKATATTDGAGRFTLRGLPKAVLWDLPFLPKEKNRYLHVRADGTGYLDQVVVVPDTADNTPAAAEVKLRPAAVVTGTLTDATTGRPVRGEVLWLPLRANGPLATGEDEAAGLYTGRYDAARPDGTRRPTDDRGRYRLDVPPGPGVLLAWSESADPSAVFTTVRVREADRKHLQADREPQEGVRVTSGPRLSDEAFDTLRVTWPLRWVNGYAVIDPPAGGRVTADLAFDPGAAVTLTPTDPDGEPLAGVTMAGYGAYGKRLPTFPTPEFAVRGLDPKGTPQQFYLLHKGRQLCAGVTLKGDERGPVAVKLVPYGSVTGRVVDHAGKPVKGAEVTFQMADYHANNLIKQKLFRDAHTATTDADGRFAFDRMFPGVEFGVYVALPGLRSGAAAKTEITLAAGERKDVGELRLRDPKATNDGEE